jgi:hypothetical protein
LFEAGEAPEWYFTDSTGKKNSPHHSGFFPSFSHHCKLFSTTHDAGVVKRKKAVNTTAEVILQTFARSPHLLSASQTRLPLDIVATLYHYRTPTADDDDVNSVVESPPGAPVSTYVHDVVFLDAESLRIFMSEERHDLKRGQGACVQHFVAPANLYNEVTMALWRADGRFLELDVHMRRNINRLDQHQTSRFSKAVTFEDEFEPGIALPREVIFIHTQPETQFFLPISPLFLSINRPTPPRLL